MKTKYDMILSAEGSFARTVALGVVVRRPLTAWHYLIPGMFLIDFLRRSAEIRKYSEHFLFPRRQAL
ncbi:MAG TPA: NF038143 family protein, partial [Desulfatiglandales bacterium]|nr:NF038143 family protein [Desulfatiglandales bacterium]